MTPQNITPEAGPVARRTGNGRAARSLVTGGGGFIGQHVAAALHHRGDEVRVLDLRAPDEPVGEFIRGSILDRSTVRRAMQGVDCVFHLAGISHLWVPDRSEYERVNAGGTRIALETASELGISRFVHCSTEAIMNGNGEAPALEDMLGPYTRSKFMAEQAALDAAAKGLPVIVVNPTATIGPGDINFTAPTAMLSMFANKPPPLVLDGVLNLVDVRDVAEGMLLAGARGRVGERYVLGGENIRVLDLLRQVGVLTGKQTASRPLPKTLALAAAVVSEWISAFNRRSPVATTEGVRLALRPGAPDSNKARAELGYAPRPIAHALNDAVTWLAGRHNGGGHPPITLTQPRA